MKEGKKTSTAVVLVAEIVAIVVLHAIKINQTEKLSITRDAGKNTPTVQVDTRVRASYPTYTLASLR